MSASTVDRRGFLASGSAIVAGAALPGWAERVLAPPTRVPGAPLTPYGTRSPFDTARRFIGQTPTPGTGSARTPLQDLHGIITPSALHFERLHAGVPSIDPARHEILVHGLVDRPLRFDMRDLLRLPAVSRIHFIECAGNSGREQQGDPGPTPQMSHGLVSCSEWTGVPARTLLELVGVRPAARWIVAEGADACRMTRSIPLDKMLDDVLVAYGQNGDALRPEQGFPVRLVVPGWEGNVNIKWLDRLHVVDRPYMTREEAAIYTDLMPDGSARMFTFVMGPKSVITRPAGGQQLADAGAYDITGLAWSGHGRVARVEVSADGGASWRDAVLNQPVLPKALTRFSLPWSWNGRPAVLQSRCTDETGRTQPTRDRLIAVRGVHQGADGFDHYNGIKSWYVRRDGGVTHG